MLEIEGLTLRSRDRLLLENLSLRLRGPGVTALLGPSGCGKSSVLKWLAGILPPGLRAEGRCRFEGAPLLPPDPRLTYQPQSDALFPWLTIAENAALGLRIAGLSARAARARVLPLFAPFGLAGCEERFPEELSGGMRQRAAFLRSMVQEGRLLLLDEPFSALDAVTRLRLQNWLLERLAEKPRAVLLVTHDLQEAARLADRILVMSARPGSPLREIDVPLAPALRSEIRLAPLRETLTSLLLEETP